MSLGYIRRSYRVPAYRGRRVLFEGRPGEIRGSISGQYLRVRLDGKRDLITLHPTWRVEYLPVAEPEEETNG